MMGEDEDDPVKLTLRAINRSRPPAATTLRPVFRDDSPRAIEIHLVLLGTEFDLVLVLVLVLVVLVVLVFIPIDIEEGRIIVVLWINDHQLRPLSATSSD